MIDFRHLFLAGFLVWAFTQAQTAADEVSPALVKYNAQLEASVEKALEFLATQQKPDGTFPGRHGETTAVASLVGMAYMSKGNTPGLGPFGENINRCIDLVLSSEQEKMGKPNGYLVRRGGKMYAHCISTLFLSEVTGMVDSTRQKKIDEILPRAVTLIVEAHDVPRGKREEGGWDYEPQNRSADLSLTGWAVMALRSAKMNGCNVPDENIKKAIRYILSCQPNGSTDGKKGFSYKPNEGGKAAMSGVGVLCLSLTGQHEHPSLQHAGDFLLTKETFRSWGGGGHFYYSIYYCTQATFQLGGEYWDKWASQLYENALSHQKKDGSWGAAYETSMVVLAMTVSYRQLPVYQR